MRRMRRVLFLFLILAACATPDYRVPDLDTARTEAERRAVIRAAMDTALERRARVYDLAWPVLAENTGLCPETRPTIGVVLADRETMATMAGGLREEDLKELGIGDHVRLLHVNAGSPAAAAGLMSGDRLLAVNDEKVEKLEPVAGEIRDALEEDGKVRLQIERDGERLAVIITPQSTCDIPVKISTSQALNASAAKGDIVIYTGLIRSLDDPALQFVIAHEAAHVALRHPRKYWRNLTVSGALFAGPFVYGGAAALDMVLSSAGDPPDISMQRRSLRFLAPWAEDFEAEADYVGLYMYARTGGDLSGVRDIFDLFSTETPSAIYTRSTHPLTPERLVRLEAAIAEITTKRQTGVELLPEPAP